jgi:hypothetical protein
MRTELGSSSFNEVKQHTASDFRSFDPDRRIDVAAPRDKAPEPFNPDKRVETGYEYIRCINESLEGKEHPDCGVPYVRRVIHQDSGKITEGVFPVFDSKFNAKISPEHYRDGRAAHNKECNRQLYDAIKEDPKLRAEFTKEQIEQIKDGDAPDGYVWHHNEEEGVMQLVEREPHEIARHTGGFSIWCK